MPKYQEEYPRIALSKCIKRKVYKIKSRNLSYGVFDGKEGFIGIRLKFASRFLFTEYHWDNASSSGTVYGVAELGIDLPEDIVLEETLGIRDEYTERLIERTKDPLGFKFVDTGEYNKDIRAISIENKVLFEFLDNVEQEHG